MTIRAVVLEDGSATGQSGLNRIVKGAKPTLAAFKTSRRDGLMVPEIVRQVRWTNATLSACFLQGEQDKLGRQLD